VVVVYGDCACVVACAAFANKSPPPYCQQNNTPSPTHPQTGAYATDSDVDEELRGGGTGARAAKGNSGGGDAYDDESSTEEEVL